METIKFIGIKHIKIKFKSYYVVWKLKKGNMGGGKQVEFKSYYVVWKPFILAGWLFP